MRHISVYILVLTGFVTGFVSPRSLRAATPKSQQQLFVDAVSNDDVKRVQEMLDEDSSLATSQLKDGTTPLHHVRSAKVAGLLLDQGADLFALDKQYHATPLRWAVESLRDARTINLELVHFLQSKGASETDIFFAVAIGDVDRVKLLITQDPSLIETAGDKKVMLTDNSVPLQLAAYYGQLAVVKLLVEHGANVNNRGGWSNTESLEKAAYEGRADVVAYLLDHGGKVDGTDANFSHSPLCNAAEMGRADAVKVLLDRGAKCPASLMSIVRSAMNNPQKDPSAGTTAEYQRILDMLKP